MGSTLVDAGGCAVIGASFLIEENTSNGSGALLTGAGAGAGAFAALTQSSLLSSSLLLLLPLPLLLLPLLPPLLLLLGFATGLAFCFDFLGFLVLIAFLLSAGATLSKNPSKIPVVPAGSTTGASSAS